MTTLIRSREWFRTWIALLAFAACLPACPAASRAETASYPALAPNMQKALSALVEKPTAKSLQAVRGLLLADRGYAPYSDDLAQLQQLVHGGKNREAVALMLKSQPNLLLSPKAHRLAAEAARQIGDETSAAAETVYAARCVEGILAAGDGSETRPFLVARMSDEIDLLQESFHTQIESQGLIFRGDRKHDKVLAKDGNTYWFDVSMLVERLGTAEAGSPVAAAPEQAHKAETHVVPPEAKALIERGLEAYRAGHYDAAVSALGDAILRDPRNAGIHVDRGNVWYVQREYEPAIADFSAAILLDPGLAAAYSNRAFAWSALGEQDQAVTDFNAAIRLQANFGRAYNGRGCAFQAKGMIDTAIADFDAAIRLDPNYAAAYENRSAAYAEKGNQASADADAAKARQLRGSRAAPAATANKVAEAPEK